MTFEVSVVMPCLNEEETLGVCIDKALRWAEERGVQAEVIIADNGSRDRSVAIAESLGARVVHVARRGYGAALQGGIGSARGEYIIMGDADDSYDFASLDPFYDKLNEGWDLVVGNRFKGGIEERAMPLKNRYLGNPFLSLIGRILFGIGVGDFHCGLRAFNRKAYEAMDLRTTGMEFASEMVIKAALFDLHIVEVPTTLRKDGRSRPPHLRPWRDGWRHLRFMLLFSPRWLFLVPGTTVVVIALATFFRLLVGPMYIGPITLDIHTLLMAACGVVIGGIAISFGVVIRFVAMREGLLPQHGMLRAVQAGPALEVGGCLGAVVFLCGFLAGGWALVRWGTGGFGPVDTTAFIRMIAIAIMCMPLGALIMVTALITGFMAIPTRSDDIEAFVADD